MSLVPTWVLCNDGYYYKNPVWRGDNWFLCFDDDDPPELVVIESPVSVDTLMKIALNLLAALKIEFKRVYNLQRGANRNFNGKFSEAFSVFVHVTAPLPPPTEFQAKAENHEGECVIYNFNTNAKKLRKTNES